METIINQLKFKPVNRFFSCGNEIQRCTTIYKGISIMWQTYFPYNIFKDPIDTFTLDLILPMDTNIVNGIMNDAYYTDEGYGMPDFKTLKDCISFIDSYK